MEKDYTIAQARHDLPAIVHEVERSGKRAHHPPRATGRGSALDRGIRTLAVGPPQAIRVEPSHS